MEVHGRDRLRGWRESAAGRFFWQFVVAAIAVCSGWAVWWFRS
jgi:hypothetical protein